MLPTQVNAHRGWWYAPHLDHTLRQPFPTPNIAQAATEASHLHLHPTIPPYGGGFRGYGRRFQWRGPSRLIWFGIGFGAAAWYYRSKQRHEEWHQHKTLTPHDHRFYANPATQPGLYSGNHVSPTSHVHGQNVHRLDADPHRLNGDLGTTTTPQTTIPAPAPLSVSTPNPAKTTHSWRWGRHHRHYQHSPTEANVLPSVTLEQGQQDDEMRKMKELVEKIWEEKKRDVAVAQEVASEKARVFAAEKLDKLSVALETLRESLKMDSKRNGRSDGKIV